MTDLPNLYFRIKENGAAVFRLDAQNSNRRLELEQVAVINTNRGDFKAQGDAKLSDADRAEIQTWLDARTATLAQRQIDDIQRAIDHLNLTAHWAQTKATDAELDVITDDLLLAMHDLRAVLVRKKADRLTKGG